jgi:uracil DNA glycosylase
MNANLLGPYVNLMFEGVTPGWKKIILSDKLKPVLNKCLKRLNDYLDSKGVTNEHIIKNGLETYIRPRPQNIFEPFKYFDPNNMRAIIIGQDPYTKQEEAQGLCFSVPSKNKSIPKSLSNIYHCLINTEVLEEDNFPDNGDLTNWARQGVLLLNRYLTRSPNIKKDFKGGIWIDGNGNSDKEFLHEFWGEFTNALLNYITNVFYNPLPDGPVKPVYVNRKNNYLAIMLWGKIAQEVETVINKNPCECEIEIYTWTHPVSYGMSESDQRHFKHCRHFLKINAALSEKKLPEINWDPQTQISNQLLNQFFGMSATEVEIYLNGITALYKTGPFYPAVYRDKINDEMLAPFLEKLSEIKPNIPVEIKETKKEVIKIIREIKESKKEIVETSRFIISIDGACAGNGKDSAKASYGLYFPAKFNNEKNVLTENCEGKLVPNKFLVLEDWQLKEIGDFVKATNGRAELLALIYAFLKVIHEYQKTGIKYPVTIIEDATYGLHMVNGRIWKYLLINYEMPSVKTNRDLVLIIRNLLLKLAEIVPSNKQYVYKDKNVTKTDIQTAWDILIQPNGKSYETEGKEQDLTWQGLTMLHQNSHLSYLEIEKVKKIGGIELEKYNCNDKVDKYCNKLLN